ncbi:MAG: pyridoxal phosphate-dependent aminotransferase [Duncaniella sp.]|nr:pyridoxal phosphate-dependent aminotransferase [Duncaniella sp.]MDE6766107.1 pyridoxal phosphate-dependent aminotransferase [Duncaniella sp.]
MADFDKVPSRIGSGSYKWDSRQGVIPLWVADMDFPTAPCVVSELTRRVEHGIFGYTLVGDEYYDALTGWFRRRHGYSFDRSRVIYTSGVVPAISAVIKALTHPGDGVIVQTPVYNCFFSSIRNNECRIVENPLLRSDLGEGEFTYNMDLEGLEKLCSDNSNTLLLLCNPHNPAGRCWTREELEQVADIARRHGVMVVSDEIHCELTMPGYSYTPYGTVDSGAVVCVSPSKAFNTAGLQIANIVTPDKDTRERIDRAININEVCDVNPFGVTALIASYSAEGEAWLEELRKYLDDNRRYTVERLRAELPQCRMARLEATYLPWIDISPTGLGADELEHLLLEDEHVWVNSGVMYGLDGYIRLNIACPRPLLAEGLDRIISALKKHL